MRLAAIITLTIGLLVGTAQSAQVVGTTYEDQTIRIALKTPQGKWNWKGSGVLIAEGALTARHVVEGKTNLYVVLRNGTGYKVASWKRMGSGDAAILYLSQKITTVAPIPLVARDLTSPARGTCLGFWGPSFDAGVPSQSVGLLSPNGNSPAYTGTIPLEFGMSGGPVIVNGSVVGLVQGKDKGGNFFVKVSRSRLPTR